MYIELITKRTIKQLLLKYPALKGLHVNLYLNDHLELQINIHNDLMKIYIIIHNDITLCSVRLFTSYVSDFKHIFY